MLIWREEASLNNNPEHFDWTVRNAVYAAILKRSVPPSVDETAVALRVSADDVRAAYERLNDRHALFLTPGSHDVRMAHPFSGRTNRVSDRVRRSQLLGELRVGRARASRPRCTPMPRIEAPIGNDGESIRFAIEAGRREGLARSRPLPAALSAAGMTTSSRPERRSSSSGRKTTSLVGVHGQGSREVRSSLSSSHGPWPKPGTATALSPDFRGRTAAEAEAIFRGEGLISGVLAAVRRG